MTTTEIDLSRMSNEEMVRLMKMLNSKQLWKDPLLPDSITNCLSIQPFKTLTSYNLWIQKNLIFIPETDEYIYISGCNVIIEKISTKAQQIIPLTQKCFVTSLTYIKTSSNERILFVGEKLFPDEKKMISGGIEIIHIDNKKSKKKLNLDLGAYVNYNCYVYDIIAGKNNETCIIILKDLNMNINKVKLFFYNYISFSLIDIEDINYNLTNILINPNKENQYLLFSNNYCALWNFSNSKLQLLLYHEFYNDTYNKNNITSVEFIRAEGKEGIAISFKNEWIEIFFKSTEEEYKESGNKYTLFLKINLFSLFKDTKIEINNMPQKEDDGQNDIEEQPEDMSEPLLDNFIEPNIDEFVPNFGNNKVILNKFENYIKFILCRGNFILIFLSKSEILIFFELVEIKNETKLRISNIELLSQKIMDNSYITIDDNLTKMVIVNGELDEKYLSSDSKQFGDNENNFDLQKISLNYFKYKLNYINATPNLEFESKILENTSLGYPIKFIAISQSPRIIIVNNGNENQDLYLYSHKLSSNLNNYLIKNNFESSSQSYIQYKHDYYQENSNFELIYHKKLEDKPLSVSVSPQGKSFFISFRDCGYLYIILIY